MSLFRKKFLIPKFPHRKASSMGNLSQLDPNTRSTEFGVQYDPHIRAKLSGHELIFENGRWNLRAIKDSVLQKEQQKLRNENQRLIEEGNLLKIKVEILLDMLAESSAEVHLQENEIENLRNIIHKKTSRS